MYQIYLFMMGDHLKGLDGYHVCQVHRKRKWQAFAHQWFIHYSLHSATEKNNHDQFQLWNITWTGCINFDYIRQWIAASNRFDCFRARLANIAGGKRSISVGGVSRYLITIPCWRRLSVSVCCLLRFDLRWSEKPLTTFAFNWGEYQMAAKETPYYLQNASGVCFVYELNNVLY